MTNIIYEIKNKTKKRRAHTQSPREGEWERHDNKKKLCELRWNSKESKRHVCARMFIQRHLNSAEGVCDGRIIVRHFYTLYFLCCIYLHLSWMCKSFCVEFCLLLENFKETSIGTFPINDFYFEESLALS